jgi:general nucleoside transport system permease protein
VWLPRLIPRTLLHSGAILAVVLAVLVYIFLWRTTTGYRIRAVGLNALASRYAGIKVPVFQALALVLGGAFAGLAGGIEVLGIQHRMVEGMSGGYGFSGIVAALFGQLHPVRPYPGLGPVRRLASWGRPYAASHADSLCHDHGIDGFGRPVRRQ